MEENKETNKEAEQVKEWIKNLTPVEADALSFVFGPGLEEHMRKTREFEEGLNEIRKEINE